jgi:hypothetical protein
MTDQASAPPTVTVPIKIRQHTIDQRRSEARRRRMRADELASAILANVIADDLFLAVLDR